MASVVAKTQCDKRLQQVLRSVETECRQFADLPRLQRRFGIDGVHLAKVVKIHVVGMVQFNNSCIINGLPVFLQQQPVHVHGHLLNLPQAHQVSETIIAVIDPGCADVQGFLVDCPTVSLEYRADRIAGKNLCMFGADDGVGLFDETDDRVGAAGMRTVFIAEERRAPQARFAAQDVDAITAELFLDAFAIEVFRLDRARAQRRRDNRRRDLFAVHNTYCQPVDGAQYTLVFAA